MKIYTMVRSFLFFICLLFFIQAQVLARPSPITMLKDTSSQMIDALKKNKSSMKSRQKVIFDLVHKILLPHVDMNIMSRITLGRTMWRQANNHQRQQFQKQYTTMLIRTYAQALASYTDEGVKFLPTRVDYNVVNRGVVRSKITRSGAQPIALNYRVIFNGETWLVYDMSVEGVSMIQSMRAQFNNEISAGGIGALLKRMQEHNKGYE